SLAGGGPGSTPSFRPWISAFAGMRGLRRRDLARPIDRGMPDMGDRDCLVGKHHGVEFDEQMPLVLVVAGDAGAHRQPVADHYRGQMPYPAAGVDPGTQDDIAAQHEIA